jgi:glycine betaine/choline ABC-type transport system substrate-binding protein
MKKIIYAFVFLILCTSCNSFVPIVKTYGYYPPTSNAIIVNNIPASAEYIGTIAIHPNDHPLFSGWDKERLYTQLKTAAANAGARYIYITNLEASSVDYWFNYDNGDGFSVRAELYR